MGGAVTELTSEQRAEIVKALTSAKRHLWRGSRSREGKTEYICIALECFAHRHPIGALHAKSMISERLGADVTFRSWLEQQGIAKRSLTYARVQQHRHAWVDQLIAEFSAPAP